MRISTELVAVVGIPNLLCPLKSTLIVAPRPHYGVMSNGIMEVAGTANFLISITSLEITERSPSQGIMGD